MGEKFYSIFIDAVQCPDCNFEELYARDPGEIMVKCPKCGCVGLYVKVLMGYSWTGD